MPKVVIDGVEYVPRAEVPEITDKALKSALESLTEIQYFDIKHKNRAVAYNALEALSPELAKLCDKCPRSAFERIHGTD